VVATEAEGKQVLALLRKGEPFEEVARRYSLSPDAKQGGDLGFFARGEMPPEFDSVVFSLPVGRLSGLVKTDYGYQIFRVEERREAVRLTLDAVRDEIRRKLLGEKEEQAYHDWLQNLRSRAAIEVNWNLL
jgi:peptidyl-prolyl cis-trans isomerase C